MPPKFVNETGKKIMLRLGSKDEKEEDAQEKQIERLQKENRNM